MAGASEGDDDNDGAHDIGWGEEMAPKKISRDVSRGSVEAPPVAKALEAEPEPSLSLPLLRESVPADESDTTTPLPPTPSSTGYDARPYLKQVEQTRRWLPPWALAPPCSPAGEGDR